MKQLWFDFGQGPKRYCNTNKDWVGNEIKCPSKCCNGWKSNQKLKLSITVESI